MNEARPSTPFRTAAPRRATAWAATAGLLVCAAFAPALSAAPTAPTVPTASVQSASATEPLSLDAAVRRALAKNYSIQVESFSVPIARAAVSEAKGRFDPRLTLRHNASNNERPQRLDADTGAPLPPTIYKSEYDQIALEGELPLGLTYQLAGTSSNDRGSYDQFADNFTSFAGVNARLPLLRGFGPAATMTSIRIAKTNQSISEWRFRATIINTVTEVIYTFNELLTAQANLRSARRSRELAQQLNRENQERFRVGSMSDYDVLSARARVAMREEAIILSERRLQSVEFRLKQLVGDERSAALLSDAIVLAPPPAPIEVRVAAAGDLPAALKLRPDYQEASLALARNDYSYRYERNRLLPAVDLVGSYGYNGVGDDSSSSRAQVRDRDHPNYSGGVVLTVPLTSATERARHRSARLARERSEVMLRQLEQDIVVQLGEAAGQIETAWKRVLASRASRDLSEKTLDSEVKRLRAGPGSTFVVLQLQEILSNEEVREARALSDYRNALAEYDRQTGRTLERHHIDLAQLP